MENKLDDELTKITKYNICDDLVINKLNIHAFVNLIFEVIGTKEKLEELETIIVAAELDSTVAAFESVPVTISEDIENKAGVMKLKTAIANSFLEQQKYYSYIMVLKEAVGLSNLWLNLLNVLKHQIKANEEKFNKLLEELKK